MKSKRLLFLSVFLGVSTAQLMAQSLTLTVTSATKSSVALSFAGLAGSQYTILRRAISDGAYPAVSGSPTTTSTTYIDNNIDPFTTYTYRIFAANTLSNEVVVGPPPVGFSVAAPTPAPIVTAQSISNYGVRVSMVLDANGDPAFAFADTSNLNNVSSNYIVLNFVGWDRAHCKWKAPVMIDFVNGQTDGTTIALAYDSSTNRFGVSYVNNNYTTKTALTSYLKIAFSSDNGATWTPQNAFLSSNNGLAVAGTSLKMANGQGYLLVADTYGIWYVTGSETTTVTGWSSQLIPGSVSSVHGNGTEVFDVDLDSNGHPAVAYEGAPSDNVQVFLWRPGSATATSIVSAVNPDSQQGLRLVFMGLNPRILINMPLGVNPAQYPTNFWVLSSNDGGNTWAQVSLPSDGNRGLYPPFTLAVGPQGQAAVSAYDNGGNATGVLCGEPKLIRSADLKNWVACNPGNSMGPQLDANYPNAQFASNGKLYLAFQHYANAAYRGDELPPGVILWREAPIASGLPAPVINVGGVVNNAGEIAGQPLAPGSIAEVYGTNLGSLSATNQVPLNTIVGPTPALTTSVWINGVPAPIYFVSGGQIDIQIPFGTQALPASSFPGPADVIQVQVNDSLSPPVSFLHSATAPGIYAVINPNGSAPVSAGGVVTVYATGLGVVSNQPADGAAAPSNPLANVSAQVTATIGGISAPVGFAGLTPGLVGLYQINVTVPAGLPAGANPLVINAGGMTNSNTANVIVTGK